jgi:hypothetical protein
MLLVRCSGREGATPASAAPQRHWRTDVWFGRIAARSHQQRHAAAGKSNPPSSRVWFHSQFGLCASFDRMPQHFRKLTKEFLRPFEEYFGIWKSNGDRSSLYLRTEDVMKPFDEQVS